MRSHSQIIKDAGGPGGVHGTLGLTAKIFTVRSWANRDSIPAEQWEAFASAGLATLEELARAAALRHARAQ